MLGNNVVTMRLRGAVRVLRTVSIWIRQPFCCHSQHRRLRGDVPQPGDLDPSQRMGFVAHAKIFFADDPENEPRIEMMMWRIVAPRRDQMDVDVEQFVIESVDRQARFFARFTARNAQRIGVAVAVSAQLQPSTEFAVMGQQHVGALRIDDPGRTRDVAAPAIAFEAARFGVHERFEAIDRCALFRIADAIARKQVEHTGPVHRTIMPCSQFSLKGITMLAIIAKLKVVPGKEAEFEKVMLGLAKEVRANEPGNKLYTLTKSEAGEYLMLELYDSEASLAAHGQTTHFKAAGPKFAGLMAGRPDIQRLDVIG